MLEVTLAFVVGFLATAVAGLAAFGGPSAAAQRLDRRAAPVTPLFRWEDREPAGWRRALARLGGSLAPESPAKHRRYRQRLGWAGYVAPRAVVVFVGAQVACGLGAGAAYTLYGLAVQRALPHVLPVSLLLGCFGMFLPELWLRRRIRGRKRQIVNALPDVLDCLVVCVEAGMGFDAALARVAEQPEVALSPLHQELGRTHLEVRAGRPRDEALKALAERAGVEELRAVVAAFVQATRLGTPLGKTLRVHADGARVQRRHRAEKQAHMAPVKMIFPTVLFLMPAFFLVAMAPPLLTLMKVFKSLGR